MYKSTEYCWTTMSFFSEKSVLQCGLHKMTELYWHLLRCMVLYITVKKINSHPVMDFQVLSST